MPKVPLYSKHEKFAQAIANAENPTQAYINVYEPPQKTSASEGASKILKKNSDVRERICELFEEKGIGLAQVSEKLRGHLHSTTETISLDTCKTILKVYGAFDEPNHSTFNADNIEITLVNLTKKD